MQRKEPPCSNWGLFVLVRGIRFFLASSHLLFPDAHLLATAARRGVFLAFRSMAAARTAWARPCFSACCRTDFCTLTAGKRMLRAGNSALAEPRRASATSGSASPKHHAVDSVTHCRAQLQALPAVRVLLSLRVSGHGRDSSFGAGGDQASSPACAVARRCPLPSQVAGNRLCAREVGSVGRGQKCPCFHLGQGGPFPKPGARQTGREKRVAAVAPPRACGHLCAEG